MAEPLSAFPGLLPPVSAVTPLQVAQFAWELKNHTNQPQVSFVLEGLLKGFRVGYNYPRKLKSASRNKPSAYAHPEIVDAYLANEVSLGRVAGPFDSPPLPGLHISSFAVIRKKGQPSKWRLIVDLSSPNGSSVNDKISPDEFTMEYIHLDHIIRMVSQHGPGALMAKFDVEAAYRNIPVHPSDRFLLGMRWHGKYYVDLAFPFGLRSAPYLFNSVADMVEWILTHSYQVPDILHYLDDFITVGPPNSPLCAQYLSIAKQVCLTLGLPLHHLKSVGPSSVMVGLGIELDSMAQIARLPADKLEVACRIVQQWQSWATGIIDRSSTARC